MRPDLPTALRAGLLAALMLVPAANASLDAKGVRAEPRRRPPAAMLDRADGDRVELRLAERGGPAPRIAAAGRIVEAPALRTLVGTPADDPGGVVYLSVRVDGSVRGIVRRHGRTDPVAGRLDSDGGLSVRAVDRALPRDPAADGALCGATCDGGQAAPMVPADAAMPAGVAMPPRLRMVRVAVDCDTAYRGLFASDDDAVAYAMELVGAVSAVFERDLGLRLRLDLVRLWPDGAEPFDAADLGGFRQWWLENDDPSAYELVHLFSGRRNLPYGGVAYLNSACGDAAFAVSGYLLGDAAGDVAAPSLDSWDLVVCAHEMGHNLGTPHTHSYDPPIDQCAGGEPVRGTIMSYCHVNAGGLLNTDLRLHARVQDLILANNPVGDCLPFDCDASGVDDAIEIAEGTLADANLDGVPDVCQDCDGNGVLDPVDIAAGAPDVDGDGRPDWCQPDCDGDGVPDAYAIALGEAIDLNGDRVPDACQPDCDGDGTADHAQIRYDGAPDVDRDGRPDGCQDCLGAGVPDWFGAGLGDAVAVADPAFGVRLYHPRSGVALATPADPSLLVVGRDVADLLHLPDGRLLASVPAGPWIAVLDPDLAAWTLLLDGAVAGGAPAGMTRRDDGLVIVAAEGGGIALLDADLGTIAGTLVAADPARPALRAVALRNGGAELLAVDAVSGAWRFEAASGASLGAIAGSDVLLVDPRDAATIPGGDVVVTSRSGNAALRIAGDDGFAIFNDAYALETPWGVAVDAEGNVLIATDRESGVRVIHYTPQEGRYVRSFVRGDAELADPRAIAVRPYGAADVDADGLPDACACPADLDGDGAVGFADLLAVLADWGGAAPTPLDLDGSGAVDFGDVLAVLGAWGPCGG